MNIFFVFCLITSIVHYTWACNGYSIKILKYQNCVDDGVIKLPEKDFNVVLDKDCNIYVTGCLEVTKPFKTANGTYQLKKAPLPLIEGDMDLCQSAKLLKKAPELATGLEMMGIPTTCPIEARKVCASEKDKFSLLKYKNQIGMAAGRSEVRLEIEHDSGKSCIEIHSSISKERKG